MAVPIQEIKFTNSKKDTNTVVRITNYTPSAVNYQLEFTPNDFVGATFKKSILHIKANQSIYIPITFFKRVDPIDNKLTLRLSLIDSTRQQIIQYALPFYFEKYADLLIENLNNSILLEEKPTGIAQFKFKLKNRGTLTEEIKIKTSNELGTQINIRLALPPKSDTIIQLNIKEIELASFKLPTYPIEIESNQGSTIELIKIFKPNSKVVALPSPYNTALLQLQTGIMVNSSQLMMNNAIIFNAKFKNERKLNGQFFQNIISYNNTLVSNLFSLNYYSKQTILTTGLINLPIEFIQFGKAAMITQRISSKVSIEGGVGKSLPNQSINSNIAYGKIHYNGQKFQIQSSLGYEDDLYKNRKSIIQINQIKLADKNQKHQLSIIGGVGATDFTKIGEKQYPMYFGLDGMSTIKTFFISGSYRKADKIFPGLLRGLHSINAMTGWRINKYALQFNYSSNITENKTAIDSIFNKDFFTVNNTLLGFQLNYQAEKEDFTFGISQFSTINNGIKDPATPLINLSFQSRRKIQASFNGNFNTIKSPYTEGSYTKGFRYSLSGALNYKGLQMNTFSFQSRVINPDSIKTKVDQFTINSSINYNYKLTPHLIVNGGIQINKTNFDKQIFWGAMGGFSFNYPKRNFSISANALITLNKGNAAPSQFIPLNNYALSLRKSIFVPLPSKRIAHTLYITTFLDENNNGQKDSIEQFIGDVPLSIGNYSLTTNKQGKAILKNLPLGNHQLSFEDLVAPNAYAFPFLKKSFSHQTDTIIFIGLQQTTEIKGIIELISDQHSNKKIDISHTRITAKNTDGLQFISFCNNKGEFILKVPKGDFTISILEQHLPTGFKHINPIQYNTIEKSDPIKLVVKQSQRKVNVNK